MPFASLGLTPHFLKALEKEGYKIPTPIQKKAIPAVLAKKDVMGCAQTGTGKTAAFALPILQLLSAPSSVSKHAIRALILTPTRELAIQIQESFSTYGKYTHLKTTSVFGGVSQFHQVEVLKKGVEILIATPGRLLDLINQKLISLRNIEIFVLDEADRMLDMGFIHDIKKLITLLPAKRQTLFFSATMAPPIMTLASTLLKNPEKIEITPVATTAETITQKVYKVEKGRKNDLLFFLLQDESIKNVLVFTKSKHGADKLVKFLLGRNISAEAIHGNKSQNNRQKALSAFKDQTTRVLVATDIASRGIDIENLEYMINYDIPQASDSYVHRIGRTGRAGAKGVALSFCSLEEIGLLRDIEKLIARPIDVVEDHPFLQTEFVPEKLFTNPGRGSVRPSKNSSSQSFETFKEEKKKKKTVVSDYTPASFLSAKPKKSPRVAPKKKWFDAPGSQSSDSSFSAKPKNSPKFSKSQTPKKPTRSSGRGR